VDRTLILLLVALALVYLAWLAAKKQTAVIRQRQAEQYERHSFTLEPEEGEDSRGFLVVTADGDRSDGADLTWQNDGVEVVPLAAFRPGPEAGEAPAFAAGASVELIEGDEPERALWVWDRAMTARAGAIPAGTADAVRRRLDAGDVAECIVLREERTAGRRTGLHLLLVHRDVDLEA
jgi:hypothetical protein